MIYFTRQECNSLDSKTTKNIFVYFHWALQNLSECLNRQGEERFVITIGKSLTASRSYRINIYDTMSGADKRFSFNAEGAHQFYIFSCGVIYGSVETRLKQLKRRERKLMEHQAKEQKRLI